MTTRQRRLRKLTDKSHLVSHNVMLNKSKEVWCLLPEDCQLERHGTSVRTQHWTPRCCCYMLNIIHIITIQQPSWLVLNCSYCYKSSHQYQHGNHWCEWRYNLGEEHHRLNCNINRGMDLTRFANDSRVIINYPIHLTCKTLKKMTTI